MCLSLIGKKKKKRRMNLYAESRMYRPDGAHPEFGSLKGESFCFRLKVIDPSKKCKSTIKKSEDARCVRFKYFSFYFKII